MKLFPAICPQCSANLNFNDSDEFVVCSHCQTKIYVSKDSEQNVDFDKFLNLAKISENSENFEEAFEYYSKAILLNSDSAEAWRGKGYAAGMLSNLVADRFAECINCHNQSLRVANSNSVDALKMEYALSLFQLARSYFDLSLGHTMQFISVPDAQFEHANRCRSVIALCEYALSLDSDLSTIKTFINDIASRCEKNRFIDEDSKIYFTNLKNKYSQFRPVQDEKSSSGNLGVGGFVAGVAAIAINYYIASNLIGIKNVIGAFFTAFLLFIPEAYIFIFGLLGILKMRAPSQEEKK